MTEEEHAEERTHGPRTRRGGCEADPRLPGGHAVADTIRPRLVWEKGSYPYPSPEVAKVAGYVAFYPEKAEIRVDGEPR